MYPWPGANHSASNATDWAKLAQAWAQNNPQAQQQQQTHHQQNTNAYQHQYPHHHQHQQYDWSQQGWPNQQNWQQQNYNYSTMQQPAAAADYNTHQQQPMYNQNPAAPVAGANNQQQQPPFPQSPVPPNDSSSSNNLHDETIDHLPPPPGVDVILTPPSTFENSTESDVTAKIVTSPSHGFNNTGGITGQSTASNFSKSNILGESEMRKPNPTEMVNASQPLPPPPVAAAKNAITPSFGTGVPRPLSFPHNNSSNGNNMPVDDRPFRPQAPGSFDEIPVTGAPNRWKDPVQNFHPSAPPPVLPAVAPRVVFPPRGVTPGMIPPMSNSPRHMGPLGTPPTMGHHPGMIHPGAPHMGLPTHPMAPGGIPLNVRHPGGKVLPAWIRLELERIEQQKLKEKLQKEGNDFDNEIGIEVKQPDHHEEENRKPVEVESDEELPQDDQIYRGQDDEVKTHDHDDDDDDEVKEEEVDEEERYELENICIARVLTEILLEVTNNQIQAICSKIIFKKNSASLSSAGLVAGYSSGEDDDGGDDDDDNGDDDVTSSSSCDEDDLARRVEKFEKRQNARINGDGDDVSDDDKHATVKSSHNDDKDDATLAGPDASVSSTPIKPETHRDVSKRRGSRDNEVTSSAKKHRRRHHSDDGSVDDGTASKKKKKKKRRSDRDESDHRNKRRRSRDSVTSSASSPRYRRHSHRRHDRDDDDDERSKHHRKRSKSRERKRRSNSRDRHRRRSPSPKKSAKKSSRRSTRDNSENKKKRKSDRHG